MLAQRINNVSLESFYEHSAGKKVVLVYPWTNYRTLFLTNFLLNAKEGLLYYRLRTDNLSLEDWLNDLSDEFRQVLPEFGTRIQEAIAYGEPDAIGQSLAAELGGFKDQRLIVFIDEFDRLVTTDRTSRFITALVDALPDNVQIALSSRMMTYQPWNTLIERGSAVVLGNQQRRNDLSFTVETQPKPQLEVRAFGKGAVFINGQEITTWEGILPRHLFFYLIDHRLVTRDQIFKDFWPALGVKDATDIFHVTKHKITDVLGRKMGGVRDYELTAYKQGFYIPSDKVVRHYDVENFHDSVERALQANSEREAEPFLIRALDLYKAPFLQGVELKWVVKRRAQLALEYSEALIMLARIVMSRGESNPDENAHALDLFLQALEQRPEREDVYRSLIELYKRLDNRDMARTLYQKLEKMLKDEFGIQPAPETMALAQDL